ncbi:MAG: hypothetical protein ABJA62_08390 [Luteimonas sp.]
MPLAPFRPFAAVLLLASASVFAGPKEDVRAAIDKVMAARSYHVSMVHSGTSAMTTEADFVAPDRFRMKMPMGTQYIIGDTMYMNVRGRSMKVPMGKGAMTQWRDPASIAKNEATMTITSLGIGMLDGKPAHKYKMVDSKTPTTSSVLWIGASGYPLGIDVSGQTMGKPSNTTIRYSRYNDPTIAIDPPK